MFISRRCDLFRWSSEDVAVVVDFHWFTDCHLEAIFNMNTSRVQFRSSITVDGKDVRLTAGVSLSEPGSAWYTSAPSITTVWCNYQTSYNDFFEVYVTETVTITKYSNGRFDQFNFLNVSHVTNRSSSSLVKSPSADISAFSWYSVMIIHKYVNVQTVVDPE